jgi:hypothetical protein
MSGPVDREMYNECAKKLTECEQYRDDLLSQKNATEFRIAKLEAERDQLKAARDWARTDAEKAENHRGAAVMQHANDLQRIWKALGGHSAQPDDAEAVVNLAIAKREADEKRRAADKALGCYDLRAEIVHMLEEDADAWAKAASLTGRFMAGPPAIQTTMDVVSDVLRDMAEKVRTIDDEEMAF